MGAPAEVKSAPKPSHSPDTRCAYRGQSETMGSVETGMVMVSGEESEAEIGENFRGWGLKEEGNLELFGEEIEGGVKGLKRVLFERWWFAVRSLISCNSSLFLAFLLNKILKTL